MCMYMCVTLTKLEALFECSRASALGSNVILISRCAGAVERERERGGVRQREREKVIRSSEAEWLGRS